MARSRNIKPGFFSNEELAECTPWARLCFAGLWTIADREGRLEDRPKRIKGELFRYDAIEVEPLLVELARGGFIQRYVSTLGLAVIQILEFRKHQNPHHKEAKSVLPPPPGSPGPASHGNGMDREKPRALPSSYATEAAESPGLHDDKHEVKARGSPPLARPENPGTTEASNGHARDLPPVARGSNRADSLISDSLISDSGKRALSSRARATGDAEPPEPPDPPDTADPPGPAEGSGTPYGLAARAMRAEGMGDAHPGDQRLRQLVDAGVSAEEFKAAAAEALAKRKGFAWALVALANRRADAAANPVADAPPAPDWRDTRQGVIEHAVSIGLPPFDAVAERLRTGPSWSRYRADVIASDTQHHRRHA